jgi:hypothetical protein
MGRAARPVQELSFRLDFDEIEAALNLNDIASHAIDTARQIGVKAFHVAQPGLDLYEIGFDVSNLTADGAEMLKN